MEQVVTCWNGCGEDFTLNAPDRQDPRLTDGVRVACDKCGEPYKFTVDGDGEPSLDSLDKASMGENISGRDSDQSTHF